MSNGVVIVNEKLEVAAGFEGIRAEIVAEYQSAGTAEQGRRKRGPVYRLSGTIPGLALEAVAYLQAGAMARA